MTFTFTIRISQRFSSAQEFQMGNFQTYWSQNVGQGFFVLDFFHGRKILKVDGRDPQNRKKNAPAGRFTCMQLTIWNLTLQSTTRTLIYVRITHFPPHYGKISLMLTTCLFYLNDHHKFCQISHIWISQTWRPCTCNTGTFFIHLSSPYQLPCGNVNGRDWVSRDCMKQVSMSDLLFVINKKKWFHTLIFRILKNLLRTIMGLFIKMIF
jgi:hypothetical protein